VVLWVQNIEISNSIESIGFMSLIFVFSCRYGHIIDLEQTFSLNVLEKPKTLGYFLMLLMNILMPNSCLVQSTTIVHS